MPHAAIVANIRGLLQQGVRPLQAAVVASPLTFDPAVVDLFLAFATGACAVLLSPAERRAPLHLLHILQEQRVDYMCTTPSLLARFGQAQLAALAAPEVDQNNNKENR